MRLLVSVIDAEEAVAAWQGGADVIDVKDPSVGALGAPAPETLRAIRAGLPAHVPVSVALGDATAGPGTLAFAAVAAVGLGAAWVKIGLAGIRSTQDVVAALSPACGALNAMPRPAPLWGTGEPGGLVAVAYADLAAAQGACIERLPAAAAAAGARGCMLDTAVKDGRSLLDGQSLDTLRRFAGECRRLGLLCGLAGSLRAADLPAIARTGADLGGVRGAAAGGDRLRGRVTARAVSALVAALAEREAGEGGVPR